jgi:hypothetical protein
MRVFKFHKIQFREEIMKTKLMQFVCLLLLCLALQAGVAVSQDIWISFAARDTSNVTTPYLMKIDASGNVVVGPKQILTAAKCPGQGCFPALTDDGDGNIVMMLARVPGQANFARTVVNASTLQAGSVKNLGIVQSSITFPGSLQVTQHVSPKFITVKTNTQAMRAFPLTIDGLLAGSSWRANPRVKSGSMFQIGVAPDAGMSWGINLNTSNPPAKIYAQPLNSKGRASTDPVVVGTGQNLDAVDITNLLSGSRRFVVFSEEGNFTGTRIIKLQVIDGVTGAKKGGPNDIASTTIPNGIQNLGLDPLGRFLVWEEFSSSCSRDIIKFQALTSNGDPTGSIKTLVGCSSNVGTAGFLDTLVD